MTLSFFRLTSIIRVIDTDAAHADVERSTAMEHIVEAEGLTKRYGAVRALAGLDLVARRGRGAAVLGPNGAGKTAFVRAVATLVQPHGGSLRVPGLGVARNPAQVPPASVPHARSAPGGGPLP